jgi:hypothetical protein
MIIRVVTTSRESSSPRRARAQHNSRRARSRCVTAGMIGMCPGRGALQVRLQPAQRCWSAAARSNERRHQDSDDRDLVPPHAPTSASSSAASAHSKSHLDYIQIALRIARVASGTRIDTVSWPLSCRCYTIYSAMHTEMGHDPTSLERTEHPGSRNARHHDPKFSFF